MNNVYKLDSEEQRYDEASLWISKLDKGLSSKDEELLRQWLSDSQENRELFLKMAEIWDKMDVLSRLTDLFPQPISHRRESNWIIPAMVASVAIVIFSLFWGVTNFKTVDDDAPVVVSVPNMQRFYQTAVGEYSTVNLPDGTRIVLNTNTSLRVDYTGKHRFLMLERGEVHVNVAHDKLRPLSVLAGGQLIQAVGTAFNIELHSDQRIELVVTEGKVLIGVHASESTNTEDIIPAVLPLSSISVSEGQQMVLGGDKLETELIEPSEIEVKLSWREGNLIFRGESLEEAIAEISRYTSVEFIFTDEKLKKIRVAGLFKAGDVNGLLETLRDNFNISSQRVEESVHLYALGPLNNRGDE